MMDEQTQSALKERLRPLFFMCFLSVLLLLLQKNPLLANTLEQTLYNKIFAPIRSLIYAPLDELKRFSSRSQQSSSLEEQLLELEKINKSL